MIVLGILGGGVILPIKSGTCWLPLRTCPSHFKQVLGLSVCRKICTGLVCFFFVSFSGHQHSLVHPPCKILCAVMRTAKLILFSSSSPFLHWPTFACKCLPYTVYFSTSLNKFLCACFQVCREFQVKLACQVLRVSQGQLVLQGHRVKQVLQGQQVHQVKQDSQGQQVHTQLK